MEVLPTTIRPNPQCCFSCIIQPLETPIVGCRVFSFTCFHTNRNSHTEFKISKLLVLRQLLLIALFASFVLFELNATIASGFVGLKSTAHTVLACISAGLAISLCNVFFTSPSRIECMKIMNYILEENDKCGTIHFASKEAEELQLYVKKCKIIFYTLVTSYVLVFIADFFLNDGRYLLIHFNIECGLYITGGLYLLSFCHLKMYKSILKNGMNRLQQDLRSSLTGDLRTNSREICEKIINFSRLYQSLEKFIELYSSTVTVPFLFMIIYVFMVLILQYKLLGECIHIKNIDLESAIMVVVVNSTGLLTTVYVTVSLKYCESMIVLGKDMMSFVFGFPISKLPKDARDQIEALIQILNMQAPLINFGYAVVLRMSFLATIFANVVTYIFVVIQFKLSLIEGRMV